jgi:hypothetical protein
MWFDADKEGLRRIAARRGYAWLFYELVSNCLDANATRITFEARPVQGCVYLKIEDDGDGFARLDRAWTLFADSNRAGVATARGRFCLGEKLVLAMCEYAEIVTTTGSVRFDSNGRHIGEKKRAVGSLFEGTVRMKLDELESAVGSLTEQLLVPERVTVTVNGLEIKQRRPITSFEVTLPTDEPDEEGMLRRCQRKTLVRVYEPRSTEQASIYELGIPVQPTGDTYHVDVCQKVPLTMERDSVPRSFLRALRAATLNATANLLTEQQARSPWVAETQGDNRVESEVVGRVMDLRFGEKRVSFDPRDPEANRRAQAEGYTVVHGGAMTADAWSRAKESGAIRSAGQVTPSPKPFAEVGDLLKVIEESKWTDAMRWTVSVCDRIARGTVGHGFTWVLANDPGWPFYGCHSATQITLNVARLGRACFNGCLTEQLLSTLIHELAHDSGGHLTESFEHALGRIGAQIVVLAAREPAMIHGRN